MKQVINLNKSYIKIWSIVACPPKSAVHVAKSKKLVKEAANEFVVPLFAPEHTFSCLGWIKINWKLYHQFSYLEDWYFLNSSKLNMTLKTHRCTKVMLKDLHLLVLVQYYQNEGNTYQCLLIYLLHFGIKTVILETQLRQISHQLLTYEKMRLKPVNS